MEGGKTINDRCAHIDCLLFHVGDNSMYNLQYMHLWLSQQVSLLRMLDFADLGAQSIQIYCIRVPNPSEVVIEQQQ